MATPPNSPIQTEILALLAKSPQFLFLLGAARLSGQGWLYIMVTYNAIPSARLRVINNQIGLTALGLLSFIPSIIVVHYVLNGFVSFEYDLSIRVIATAVVFSLAGQLVILLLTVFRGMRQ